MIISNWQVRGGKYCCLIVLDRDGTLIFDSGYVHKVEELEFIPGVLEALKMAQNHNALIYIVTNQGGIGLEKFDLSDYLIFNKALIDELLANSINIDCVIACPHHQKSAMGVYRECECRKPKSDMLKCAITLSGIERKKVAVFGDSERDLQMAKDLGVTSFLVHNNLKDQIQAWIDSH